MKSSKKLYDTVTAMPKFKPIIEVEAVFNKRKIAMNVSPIDVKDKIRHEFERNARIDANNIQVTVEDNLVILKGTVRNLDEYKEAKRAVWPISAVTGIVADKLTIR